METVIARGQTFRDFYCGACEHSWRVADDGQRSATPADADNPRGDRSRS